MDRRRLPGERRQSASGIPVMPSSPQHGGHTRTGSAYASIGNPRKAQTKAAAQRLAAVMANKHSDDDGDGDGDDYDQPDHSTASRPVRPRSPMNKNVAQRRVPHAKTQQQADDDDDEDDLLVSGPTRLGLGGRAVRPQPLVTKNIAQKRMPQAKTMAQRPVPPSDGDSDEDDLTNSTVSGRATIGLGGRARPSSPLSVRDQPRPARSTSGLSLYVNTEQSVPAHSRSQTSHSISSVEQSMSPHSTSDGRSSLQSSGEQLHTRQASSVVRSSSIINSSLAIPKPILSITTPNTSADGRREKRLTSDFGSMDSLNDRGREQSASALQDELDMLQDENGSLLEKLQLTEERCEEAEARARLLEQQIADLGEGATLEAHLLSRKEAAQQEEAASRGGTQTQSATPEQIAALQTEAEIARDETNSVLGKLSEKEFEIKALQTITQRMMLTEEEMEEVVLKRCWLARYWSLCVEHGIQADIARKKHEYWSSFAPLPVEIVLAAGQRAREEDISSDNDLEEREKVLQQTGELSRERNVESMLLVEKGLRELASLKVEDAVAYAMATQRRQNMIKNEEVKLPTEGQFEVFELSQEESEDVRFKQAWLTYFWRRAMNHGVEADIADERLHVWVNRSSQSPTSQDAVDVERGLMEIRKLGLESQLWKTSRRGLEIGTTTWLNIETGF